MARRKSVEDQEARRLTVLEMLRAQASQPDSRGRKYREFLACEGEIREALAAGYTNREIWEVLVEDGRVSLAYGTFGDYVNRRIGRRARLSLAEDVAEDVKVVKDDKSEDSEGELDSGGGELECLAGV